jgi:glycosyltransferase involved in cell wall biosynthesis
MSISVAIPVFESDRTLHRALLSINDAWVAARGSEHWGQLEVIAVLDGHHARCRQILEEFFEDFRGRSRVVEIVQSGIAAARNAALELAQMKMFTVLDADDEITEYRFREVSGAEGAPVMGRHELVIDLGGSPLPLERDHQLNYSSLVVSTELARALGGFDTQLKLASDLEFVGRIIAHKFEIRLSDSVFVRRHLTGENASLNRPTLMEERFISLSKFIRDSRAF